MLTRLKKVLAMTPEQEQRVMPRVEKLQEARRGFAYNTPTWRFPGGWAR